MKTSTLSGSLAAIVGIVATAKVAAESDAGRAVKPPDVYVRVGVVQQELKSIRFVMGRPENKRPPINVKGAQPREVYFQAVTLFRKAERLCFEHTRRRNEEPARPKRALNPGDVLNVVDAALERLQRVKEKLGIKTKSEPAERNDEMSPTDVFRAIVDANRQLNLLLDRRFTPSDVYMQVTRAIALASRLLETFPEAATLPDAPEFVPGKRPADVYRRLVGCYKIIRKVATASGERMLEFQPYDKQIERAEPSDVYDVASLLVAELAYLHAKLPAAKPPRKAYYPGRKFPSHVFQRAGILERQLLELQKRVAKNSKWLNGSGAKR